MAYLFFLIARAIYVLFVPRGKHQSGWLWISLFLSLVVCWLSVHIKGQARVAHASFLLVLVLSSLAILSCGYSYARNRNWGWVLPVGVGLWYVLDRRDPLAVLAYMIALALNVFSSGKTLKKLAKDTPWHRLFTNPMLRNVTAALGVLFIPFEVREWAWVQYALLLAGMLAGWTRG